MINYGPINGSGKLFTEAQAAARLGVCVRTLRNRTKAGLIAYVNLGTPNREIRRYAPEAIDDYLTPKKLAEKPPCPSTSALTVKLTASTFKLGAVAFTEIQAAEAKKKLKPKSES